MAIILYTLSILLILSTLIPFIKSDQWYIRVFDYPRFQKLFLLILVLILGLFIIPEWNLFNSILFGIHLICVL